MVANAIGVLLDRTGRLHHQADGTARDTGSRALKIAKTSSCTETQQWYYVESRQPTGYDGFLSGNANVIRELRPLLPEAFAVIQGGTRCKMVVGCSLSAPLAASLNKSSAPARRVAAILGAGHGYPSVVGYEAGFRCYVQTRSDHPWESFCSGWVGLAVSSG